MQSGIGGMGFGNSKGWDIGSKDYGITGIGGME